ncbi:PEP-CTERM sorting domain-containing protein [Denitromonas ohlonensis]|uniref:PEP-CTERM sorting domain-containing protein n=3 Tax=Denitromonas TaxID=139331 RepID=A0A557SMK1_9RHOO|nr:PEP-CTERM sorting domain-containing protein [Denitromonas ohlonensis]TVO78655.1 PEP-CTERM sorting domain-containing protein [Denitromonas ohlonensis]
MTGVAHADIQNANIGATPIASAQSELVFSAWSDTAQTGFTWDVEHSGFLSAVSDAKLLNIIDANPKQTASLTGPASIESKVAGVNGVVFDMKITGFDAFLNATGGANDVKFNLFAGNSVGLDVHLASFGSPLGALSGGIFDDVGNTFVGYVNAVNGKMAGTNATDDAVVTTAADGVAYAGSAAWGNATLYPGLSFNAGLGEAIAVAVLYGNNTVAAEAKAFTLNGDALQASTYLAQDGYHLQIAAVPAVPEPETYAMLLAGLGLVGAIARRRSI